MKKIKRFELRLSEEEALQFMKLEEELGISRTELVRSRVLKNTSTVLVNAKDLIRLLNRIGEELGRSGNNINQLARHANILAKEGVMNSSVINDFNSLFGNYIRIQQDLDKAIRQTIRLMKS